MFVFINRIILESQTTVVIDIQSYHPYFVNLFIEAK